MNKQTNIAERQKKFLICCNTKVSKRKQSLLNYHFGLSTETREKDRSLRKTGPKYKLMLVYMSSSMPETYYDISSVMSLSIAAATLSVVRELQIT